MMNGEKSGDVTGEKGEVIDFRMACGGILVKGGPMIGGEKSGNGTVKKGEVIDFPMPVPVRCAVPCGSLGMPNFRKNGGKKGDGTVKKGEVIDFPDMMNGEKSEDGKNNKVGKKDGGDGGDGKKN